MGGLIDPYMLLAATSSIVGAWVLLLFAYRRIPKQPPAASIQRLEAMHLELVDAFQDLADRHDETIGRSNAKIGSLRRKLRKVREEEGYFDEDDEEGESEPEPPQQPTLAFPDRATLKAQARARKAARG